MRPTWDHRLARNEREWSPARCIFLDTETKSTETEYGQALPLDSWELCLVRRDKPKGHAKREEWVSGRTGLELAAKLDELVTTQRAVWLWAHNLGFDLATTRLPVHLARLGWVWTLGTITADSPWMKWRKGNKTLSCVDSFSHLPAALAKIGESIGLPKLEMPPFDAPAEQWDTYRHRDVEILRDSVLEYLEWWDREKLGNLSVSGAATGWNAWRHTKYTQAVEIDVDEEKRKWGRAAIYGGRRSAWRVGELGRGPWVEIDIRTAHLSICRNELLPVQVLGWVQGLPTDHRLIMSERAGVLADCTVSTSTPRYPLLTAGGVLYPTGTFQTRLAGPELRLAAQRGELLEVRRGLAVALGRPMQAWAEWIGDELDSEAAETPAVARLAMKGWSRTVIGKWAGRTSREVLRVPWPDDDWRVETGFHNDPSVPSTTIYGNGEMRTFVRDLEGHDSFPAVYAWITSHMRVVLGRLLEMFPPETIVACNTDSVVVNLAGLDTIGWSDNDDMTDAIRNYVAELERWMAPYRLSIKHIADSLRIRTPEHLVFGDGETMSRKVASVSKHAKEVDPWVFEGDTWPGLAKQLSLGKAEEFQLHRRRVSVNAALPLSWVTDAGLCVPPHYEVDKDGRNVMTPPDPSVVPLNVRRDAFRQHQALRAELARK